MNLEHVRKAESTEYRPAGVAGWLWQSLKQARRGFSKPAPRLALVERITLAPKQTLALVEAEGRRFLVASSAEGAPAFFALDGGRSAKSAPAKARGAKARIAW